MGLRAGDLRETVVIQRMTEVDAGAGEKTRSWYDVDTVWAKIEPLNGGEAFRAGIANNTQFYRVTIRWRSDVTPRDRLQWGDWSLNIRTAGNPDLRREALVMTVESGVPDA